jgi:hypothetical protein
MGWLEDLAALKDEIDVGGKVGTAAHKAVDLLNLPSDIGKEVYGQAQNVLQGEDIGDWGTGHEEWNREIANLRGDDWGQFGILKTPVELAANLAIDPTTYLGLGLAGKAAGLAGKAGLTGLETGLNVIEKGYQLPGKLALEGGTVPGAIPGARGAAGLPQDRGGHH